MNISSLLPIAIEAAQRAGKAIMEVHQTSFDVERKQDQSPLTIADMRAHAIIYELLAETGFPILSEEGKNIDYEERKDWEMYWLVDPLDGTKEFVNAGNDFTVNIALIKYNKPVLGVIYVPVEDTMYHASEGAGAFKTEHFSQPNQSNSVFPSLSPSPSLSLANLKPLPLYSERKVYSVVASKSHLNPETKLFIDSLKEKYAEIEIVNIGSSLKICLVAEGRADIYPRFGPTMEWDTAAGQAIAEISGCVVWEAGKTTPLQYNKPSLLNPGFVVERM